MPRAIAYVLKSFPEPSETFIAEEALSLTAHDFQARILHTHEGNSSVVHPSAKALIDQGMCHRLGTTSRLSAFAALAWLMRHAPIRTLRTLALAMRHADRWCYIQSLPAAVWCLRQRVEFLHAHFADVNFVYAAAIAAWTGIPYGVTTHRYDIFEDPLDRESAAGLFRDAALVVTVSEYNRRHMANKYGLPTNGIHVVHCGIDLVRFAFSERMARQAGGPLRIVNVGRLAPMKAHDVLLNALSLVKARGVPFALEVVGAGPLHAELTKMASDLDIAHSVVFHGAKDEAFVRERLAAADLFVLSSRSEGLPVACMEALAIGTTTIATRIFGIPELIEDGVSGLLVPPDDPQALANSICTAHANPLRLQSMRTAGRRAVEAGFERGECTRQLTRLWADAIARSGD